MVTITCIIIIIITTIYCVLQFKQRGKHFTSFGEFSQEADSSIGSCWATPSIMPRHTRKTTQPSGKVIIIEYTSGTVFCFHDPPIQAAQYYCNESFLCFLFLQRLHNIFCLKMNCLATVNTLLLRYIFSRKLQSLLLVFCGENIFWNS